MSIDCNLVDDIWSIKLLWPEDPDFYIDPFIQHNLKKWHPKTTVFQIPFVFMVGFKYLETLNDNWSLYGWSKWLKSLQKHSFPKKITIIHLDDHDDLMSPKAYFHQGRLYDIFTKKLISIYDPQSIKSAILSGAIGIGEFILPLLCEFPCVEIRHLCQTTETHTTKKFSILLNRCQDVMWPQYERISAYLSPYKNLLHSHTYIRSSNIESLLDMDENSSILLHFDLDYLNNRYNGCSDWAQKKRIFDPNFSEIEITLHRFFSFLEKNNLLKRLDYITVGISPGFFPSEFWTGSLDIIRSYIKVDN